MTAKNDRFRKFAGGRWFLVITGWLLLVGAWIRWWLYQAINQPDTVPGRLFLDKLYTQEEPLFGGGHFFRAMSILHGSSFLNPDDFVEPPGMTFLLAALFGSGLDPAAVQVLWLIASVAVMILSWLTARHWLSPIWQVFALALLATDITAASYGSYLTGEIPSSFLFILGAFLISRALRSTYLHGESLVSQNRAVRSAGMGGLLIALSTFFWSMGLGVAGGICVVGLFSLIQKNRFSLALFPYDSWRRVWRTAAIRCFSMLVLLSAAIFMVTGKVGVTNLGNPFRYLIAHVPEPRIMTFENASTGKSTAVALTFAYQRRAMENYKFPFGPSNRAEVMGRATQLFKDQPIEFINQSLVNSFNMFSGNIGWPSFTSPVRQVVEYGEVLFLYLVIVPLATLIFLPAAFGGPSVRDPRGAFLLLMLGFFLFGLVHPGEVRHRVPIDGLLVMLALLLIRDFKSARRPISDESSP